MPWPRHIRGCIGQRAPLSIVGNPSAANSPSRLDSYIYMGFRGRLVYKAIEKRNERLYVSSLDAAHGKSSRRVGTSVLVSAFVRDARCARFSFHSISCLTASRGIKPHPCHNDREEATRDFQKVQISQAPATLFPPLNLSDPQSILAAASRSPFVFFFLSSPVSPIQRKDEHARSDPWRGRARR
jgi:hypothetical protein